ASHIAFLGTQPAFTQVPPRSAGSSRATFAPSAAARKAPASPPEPPPTTIRSKSLSMPPWLHGSCEAGGSVRRGIHGGVAPGDEVGEQLSAAAAHADAHHAVAGRQPQVLVPGRLADDRHVVAGHRPPAVPAFLYPRAHGAVQVLSRTTF